MGQLQKTSIDWWPRSCRTGNPGIFGGFAVADKVPGGKLEKAFAWFIIVLGLVIGALTQLGSRYPAAEAEVSGVKSLWQRSAMAPK